MKSFKLRAGGCWGVIVLKYSIDIDMILNLNYANILINKRKYISKYAKYFINTDSDTITKVVDNIIRRRKVDIENIESALDLGCGGRPRNPFSARKLYGVDAREDLDKNVYKLNIITEKLPFKDEQLCCVTAYDFLEHIPRQIVVDGEVRYAFIELMNEIYRVVKVGGYFLHVTPYYPAVSAFTDPTHVNYISKLTMEKYFCLPSLGAATLGYGFKGSFDHVERKNIRRKWIVELMKKTGVE